MTDTIRVKKRNWRKKWLLASAVIPAILFAGSAMAQEQEGSDAADTLTQDVVIVTGSHIKGSQVTETLPVTVLGIDDIVSIGTTDGDELFRSLPSQGEVDFRDDNTGTVNSARGDVASINLRSLGPGNTLVLLNGRRMVNHPGTQSNNLVPSVTVNTNTIPIIGLERLEVLRDGASALYGSDAVAGVVNSILKTEYEGLTAGIRYGFSEGTDLKEGQVSILGGKNFNNDKTNVSLFATFSVRNGLFANERPYSANADGRSFVEGTDYEGDTSFDNRSTRTPWGQFDLPFRVRQNGVSLTSASGRLHIQPDTLPGCRGTTAEDLATPGICIDDGSLDRALRYNPGAVRQLISDRDRFNVFVFANHELDNGIELYGEAGIYGAVTNSLALENTSISSGDITIPANNYWNPFGPVTFSDGSINPNRLPNLDNVPDEGIPVDVNGARYRFVDAGQREIEVTNDVYRLVGGARGEFGKWDWDTGIVYSAASTEDITDNRISSTLLQQALFNETPSAYNFFNGADPNNPTAGDTTPNPQVVIDPFLISVRRASETYILLVDFGVSTSELFDLPGGSIGAAFGVEARQEGYSEDRDDRLDGTITYTNAVTGAFTGSDVLGTSPTFDSDGSRTVYSAYGEFFVPLIGEHQNIPLVHDLSLQLAGRIEEFSDVGSSGFKPRVAGTWSVFDWLKVRGSWSEGFRAPNLPQINEIGVARSNTREDSVFCEAGVQNGTFANFAACDGFTESREERRQGNPDLAPEESTNITYGIVIDPQTFSGGAEFLNGFTFTVDWWDIEQEGLVGIFGGGNHIDLDYALRAQGSFNPAVVRDAPDADDIAFFAGTGLDPVGEILFIEDIYLNLLPRNVRGIDYGLYYKINDTGFGDFNLKLNAAQMRKFFVSPSPNDLIIQEAVDSGLIDDSITVAGSGSQLERNGRPKWRGSASLTWRHDSGFGMGARANYVGEFEDTSTGPSATGGRYIVDDWLTFNLYAQYESESEGPLGGTRFRIGANNIANTEPPFLDTVRGFSGALHSARQRYIYFDIRKEF